MAHVKYISKWHYLKHFHPGEAWGNPDKMDAFTLVCLDRLRDKVGYPFIVHCGYATSGHAPDSQHYVGNAVDFHIKTTDLSFLEQIKKLEYYLRRMYVATTHGRIPLKYFCGLGIYPQGGKRKIPYFHFDTRGYKARWSFLDGEYVSWRAGISYCKQHGI